MICPKCNSDSTAVGTTHYICNNDDCMHEGVRTQFKFIIDEKVNFPYDQIFNERSLEEFYKKPYLVLKSYSY